MQSQKDASLLLMPKLRDAMQTILDDLQSDVQDELEKVSLERLASIDTDLLIKIKRTAEDSLRNGGAGNGSHKSMPQNETDTLSFLVETRTPETIVRSKAWAKLKLDHLKETHDMIAALQHLVIDVSKSEARYTQKEAIEMTGALAAAGATASILTNALEQINDEEKKSKSSAASGISGGGAMAGAAGATSLGFTKVNKKLFTNEGIKKKNEAVIGILYEVGLPFVSSADGRRFGTQLELSNHLDALFKKG
jgi:pre-mRNA cleavage complex 2 protein Pcf11